MDENNNLGNSNLDNKNANNKIENSNNPIENANNPYVPNTEDNPYYNPYFQNNDVGNSPYYDNTTINNDIYNQTYMNVQQDDSAEPNDNSQDNNQENSQDSALEPDNANNSNTTDNIAENTNLNNMAVSSEPQNNEPLNDLNTNTIHVNPILSQSINPNPISQDPINQSSIDPNQDFNNNQTSFQNFAGQDNSQMNDQSFSNDQSGFQNFAGQDNSQMNNQDFNNNQSGFQNFAGQDNSQMNDQGFSNDQSGFQNSYGSSNDEEFKKAWMGTLYEKANRRKFSIPAFFFGGIYYLYRKLYLFGFIFTLISCAVSLIGIYATFSSLTNMLGTPSLSSAILPMLLTTLLPIIINIVYAFAFYPLYKGDVNKKLEKYKVETQSPAQLLDIANKKGGTSIPFVLLGILASGIISSIALTIIITSTFANFVNGIFTGLPQNNQNENENTLVGNNAEDNLANYLPYNFYEDYFLEYDASTWSEDGNGALINGTYQLSYIQSLEGLTGSGFDINTNEGRSSFFTYLYNLFSSQIDATTTTLELGSSSFILDNGIYYSYFDLVYADSIERCYFILLPESDVFIEFILSNTDTIIPDEIHEEVVSYICLVTNEPLEQENDAVNGNSLDGTTDDGIPTSSSIDANVVNVNDNTTTTNGSNSSNTVPSSNGGLTVTSPSSVSGITTEYNVVTQ